MSQPSPSKRLFVGTLLPPNDQSRLAGLQEHEEDLVRILEGKPRWVQPSKLHVTWLFLGQLDEESEQEATIRLSEIARASSACRLKYSESDLLPNRKAPRLLALVDPAPEPGCIELANRIRRALGHLCQEDEVKQFRPHITLFRFPRSAKPLEHRALADWFPPGDILPLHQEITRICLIESHLGAQKSDYEIVASFVLPID